MLFRIVVTLFRQNGLHLIAYLFLIRKIIFMKPLVECLDILLLRLIEDWNNYGDSRKELSCEEMMTTFGLEPQYKKHEFFVGLINKLIKDGYAQLIDSRPYDSEIQQYQRNTIITITGYYFRLRDGGYTKEAKRRKILEWPKTNWHWVALIAFVVGLFTDVVKTAISQTLLPDHQKSKQILTKPSNKSSDSTTIITDTTVKNGVPSFYDVMAGPIYKTKDGKTYTKKQLLSYGYSGNRIRDGVYNGILTPVNQSLLLSDGNLKLWSVLGELDLYSKSYEEFKLKYNSTDSIDFLFNGLTEDKMYSKSKNDFYKEFFEESLM